MKGSAVRVRSPASPFAGKALGPSNRPLDEPELARDSRIDAGAADAAGKDPGAHRADQPGARRRVGDHRSAAVARAGRGVEAEPAVIATNHAAEGADHGGRVEERFREDPLALARGIDALL